MRLVSGNRTGPTRTYGLNISPLHSSGAPASEFDGPDGTFNVAAMYANFALADQLGVKWLRVGAPWAPDTAALATPLPDRLNILGINAAARGFKLIVDNGVPPLYNAASLINGGAYSTQSEAQLEQLCYDAMVLGPTYGAINKVEFWGLWNEGNLQVRLAHGLAPLFGGGLQASDFDSLLAAHRSAACLRGMARAVRDHGGKVSINYTHTNIGWPLFLRQQGVDADLYPWHVYADSTYDIRKHAGDPAPVTLPDFGIVSGQTEYDIPAMQRGLGPLGMYEEVNAQERYSQTSTSSADTTALQGDMSLTNMLVQTGRATELDVVATILYRSFDQDDHPAASEQHFGLARNWQNPVMKGAARALLPFTKPGSVIAVS